MGDVKGVTTGPVVQGGSTGGEGQGTAVVGAAEKNLADVAKRLGVSIELLEQANPGITESTPLRAGQKLKLPGNEESKSSSPPANDPPPTTTELDSKLRLGERGFEGTLVRADLNSKMPTMFPGPVTQDPIEKIKMMQFIGEGPDKLGKHVADVAKYDPVTAAKMYEAVSHNASISDQAAISAALTKNMSDQDLKKLTNKAEGRQFLDQVEKGMNTGNVETATMAQMERIRNARLAGPMTPQERPGLLLRYAMGPGAFKDQWLGNQLANDIKKDPAAGMTTARAVLAAALPGDKGAIASRIAENLDFQKLKDLAKTTDGKNFFQQLTKELPALPPPGKHLQVNRMESAQITADLEANPVFGRLSEPTRKNISETLERTQYNSGISKEIASLATTPGFEKLSEATRAELVEAMAKKGIDGDYANMLRTLAGDAEFQGLSDTARTSVIDNLTKFTETSNYKDMSVVDQRRSLNIISNMALNAAANPSNAEANNTLKHIATGSVALKLYEDTHSTIAGYMEKGTLHLNVGHSGMSSPSNRLDQLGRGQLLDTSAHELNHLLNGDTAGGTRERFLDEYRAFYTGTLAKGENPPTVSTVRARVKHLAANAPSGSSYDHLRERYKKDPDFKRVVDKMLSDLNATPPHITTPEELRSALLALPGGNKSKYLNKIPNLDNHY
jgi:hypothetical protein